MNPDVASSSSGLPAIPTENSTATFEPFESRTILEIILSCLPTLILALYSVLSLNVNQSKWGLVGRKLMWVLIGAVAPEWLIWTAIEQRGVAKDIKDRVNHILECHKPKPNGTEPNETKFWSLSMGFFAASGGFEVQGKDKMDRRVLTEDTILTPEGFLMLVELRDRLPKYDPNDENCTWLEEVASDSERWGWLKEVDEEAIEDKNKRDWIRNAIICIQIFWVILQVCARGKYKLPITLLEWNTLAHVVCAFATIILWWDKPVDVNVPMSIVVNGALLAVFSQCSEFHRRYGIQIETNFQCKSSGGNAGKQLDKIKSINDAFRQDLRLGSTHNNVNYRICGCRQDLIAEWNNLSLYQQYLLCNSAYRKDGQDWLLPGEHLIFPGNSNPYSPWAPSKPVHLTRKDISRFEHLQILERESDSNYNKLKNWTEQAIRDYKAESGETDDESVYLVTRVSETGHRMDSISKNPYRWLSVFCGLYGGILQVAAWTSKFPTTFEQTLWLVAAFATCFAGFMVWRIVELHLWLERCKSSVQKCIHILLGVCVVIIGLLRVFVIIEGFISLRCLSDEALTSIAWVEDFPHY